MLNARSPCNGVVDEVPTKMKSTGINECIVDTLNLNWKRIASMLKSMVVFRRRTNEKINKKYGLAMRLHISTLTFTDIFLNHLLTISLFGPNFSPLLQHRIVYKSNDVNVLHIFSHLRIKEIFTFGGMDASTYYVNDKMIICCWKNGLAMRLHISTLTFTDIFLKSFTHHFSLWT